MFWLNQEEKTCVQWCNFVSTGKCDCHDSVLPSRHSKDKASRYSELVYNQEKERNISLGDLWKCINYISCFLVFISRHVDI